MKTTFKVFTLLTLSLFIDNKVNAQESSTNSEEEEQTSAKIEFVGNANIQKSLTNGDDIPANTGIGVIYTENLNKRFKALHSIEIELNINIASTVDTLKTKYDTNNNVINKSEFGNSILLPSNSGQAFGFRFKGYLTRKSDETNDSSANDNNESGEWFRDESPLPILGIISGFNVNFNGANRNWYDKNTNNTIKVSNLSFYAGLFHEFVTRVPSIREKYSITFGVGLTGRLIGGDLASDDNRELRKIFLGSDRTSFLGFEANLGMRLKNIRAEIRLPLLSQKDKISGLSGIQPNTFIGFVGGFSLELN